MYSTYEESGDCYKITFISYIVQRMQEMLSPLACKGLPVFTIFIQEKETQYGYEYVCRDVNPNMPNIDDEFQNSVAEVVRELLASYSIRAFAMSVGYPNELSSLAGCLRQIGSGNVDVLDGILHNCNKILGAIFFGISKVAAPIPLVIRVDAQTWVRERITETVYSPYINSLLQCVYAVNSAIEECVKQIHESLSISLLRNPVFPPADFSVDGEAVYGCLFDDQSAVMTENSIDLDWASNQDRYLEVINLLKNIKLGNGVFHDETIENIGEYWRRQLLKVIDKRLEALPDEPMFLLHETELEYEGSSFLVSSYRKVSKRRLDEPSIVEKLAFAPRVKNVVDEEYETEKRRKSEYDLVVLEDKENKYSMCVQSVFLINIKLLFLKILFSVVNIFIEPSMRIMICYLKIPRLLKIQ